MDSSTSIGERNLIRDPWCRETAKCTSRWNTKMETNILKNDILFLAFARKLRILFQ